jgi:hypothetical protein
MHTAEGHAREMLETCGQLAAGLGARGKSERSRSSKENHRTMSSDADTTMDMDGVGNAPLRLWVGQQLQGEYLLPAYMLRF